MIVRHATARLPVLVVQTPSMLWELHVAQPVPLTPTLVVVSALVRRSNRIL